MANANKLDNNNFYLYPFIQQLLRWSPARSLSPPYIRRKTNYFPFENILFYHEEMLLITITKTFSTAAGKSVSLPSSNSLSEYIVIARRENTEKNAVCVRINVRCRSAFLQPSFGYSLLYQNVYSISFWIIYNDFANKVQSFLFTLTPPGKKEEEKQTVGMNALHFQQKKRSWLCQNEWKLRRKLTIAAELRMKCKEVNRPKYMRMAAERILHAYFRYYQMELIDSFIHCMYAERCTYFRHYDQHLWCICHRYRCDNMTSIYAWSFRNNIDFFYLLLAFDFQRMK